MLHAWNVIFSFLATTTAVQKKLVNERSRKRLKHCATATGSFGIIAGESFSHTITHDSCLQQHFKSVLEKSETKYQHDKKYVSKGICLNLGTPQTNFMCPFLSLYVQRRPWKPQTKVQAKAFRFACTYENQQTADLLPIRARTVFGTAISCSY